MDLSLIAPPKPYGALIFDCDGTLVDTMPAHFEAWRAALRARAADIGEERFYQLGGVPTAEIIRILNRENGYGLDVMETHDDKEKRYLDLLHSVEEIDAVADIARANHGQVPMAVASGGLRRVVERTLELVGLDRLFDAVVTADDVVRGKPHPDIFLLAADKLGARPEECVVYEDGDAGIVGARAAGMRVVDVRVLWG